MTIARLRSDARRYSLPGFIGDWATSSDLNKSKTLINKAPATAQVDTITVDTATNSHEYTFAVNGVTISYTADASTSTTEIAAGLAAAVEADPVVRGVLTPDANVAVLTLTANVAGVGFTTSDVDAKCTLVNTTANDEADPVPFGRAMISGGYSTQGPEKYGSIAKSASFTAQVDTLTPIYQVGTELFVSVRFRGQTYKAMDTQDTSLQDSVETIAAQLNALLPANSVAVTEDNSTLTFTAEIAGEEFWVDYGYGDGGTAITFTKTSNRSRTTSLALAFAGISLRSGTDVASAAEGTEGQYAANAGVLAAQSGEVWVASSQTISEGDDVYVEGSTAADLGKFYNSSSSTRILLPQAKWARDCLTSADARAVVRI